jgi:hypothetical protein
MGLNAEKCTKLSSVGLMDLFDRNHDEYFELAQRSYEFAAWAIEASGEPVRQDDVVAALILALPHNLGFLDHKARKKLSQNFWLGHFAELIVDNCWEELTDAAGRPGTDADGSPVRRRHHANQQPLWEAG